MSDDDSFAPPPFDPAAARVSLQRQLRDLRGLIERAGRYELRGLPVIELTVTGAALEARIAKRPAAHPEWTVLVLKNGADVRRCFEQVKLAQARWNAED